MAACGVAALFSLLQPDAAGAQATIPAPGVAVIDLSYQHYRGGDHIFSTDAIDGQSTRGYEAEGNRWYLGDTRARTLFGSVDLGLNNHLGLALGAAVVRSGYFGYAPVDPVVDDGEYHTDLQDAFISIRRPFPTSSFLLTPSLGATFPLQAYPHEGHSAPGRHLVEVRAGLHALKGIGPYASIGYAGIDATYGVITNVSDPQISRLTVAARVGYYQSRRITFYALGSLLETFGGLEWASADPSAPTGHGSGSDPSLHTQVSAAREAVIGTGVQLAVGGSAGIHAGLNKTVWGENVEDALIWNAGITWAFRLFGHSPSETVAPGAP